MNRKRQVIIVLLFLFFAASVFGQEEKIIGKADFESVVKTAQANFSGRTYRRTQITETFGDRNESAASTLKFIDEYISPGKHRHVYEYKSSFNNERRETIEIGEKRYIKIDDLNWEESKEPFIRNEIIIRKPVEFESYKLLGKKTLNNQTVKVYEEKKKFTESINGNINKETRTTTHWINEAGLLIKTQIETESEAASGRKDFELMT